MKKLDPSDYASVAALYAREAFYFPLIGAVLDRVQDGVVYADESGAAAFVQHAFGFAQSFGALDSATEIWLERHILAARGFDGPKLRLYAPEPPAFLLRPEAQPFRSERQRFRLASTSPSATQPQGLIASASAANIDLIDRTFGVVTRFWRTAEDFIAGANCVLVTRDGTPAALCYAAAISGGRAEIDVLTLPEFRGTGLGRFAVDAFNARCAALGISPLWDCYTNNAGSMGLARAAGFKPIAAPYAFFTIPK